MDPRIHSEPTGSSSDSSSSEDGAKLTLSAPKSAPALLAGLDFDERRKTPRFRCSGSVQFRVASSDVRMWGTLTDISLHGCYVEMSKTFPIETLVHLVLKSCGYEVQSAGRVRTSFPAVGMGIRFTDIEQEQQRQLQELLAMLAGPTAAPAGEAPQQSLAQESMRSPVPEAILDEITEFFRTRHILSRDEFHQIASRPRRS